MMPHPLAPSKISPPSPDPFQNQSPIPRPLPQEGKGRRREGEKKFLPSVGRNLRRGSITFPPFTGLMLKNSMIYQKNLRLGFPIYYNADGELLGKAREQRKDMTSAEKRLWQVLRRKKLGMKFRRQHPINRFIADFYCHEAKLVIEVDGGYHEDDDQREYDIGRTAELKEFGILVVRFTNEEVEQDLEVVIQKIRDCLL